MNKTQTKKRFKEALNNPELYSIMNEDILNLANQYRTGFGYPEAKEIWVQKSAKWGNLQFCTEHGTFSYIKAIDYIFGKIETPQQRFTSAIRRHLHLDMMEYKRKRLPCVCPHTGVPLNMRNSHVDHVGVYEFRDIVSSYLSEGFVDVDIIEYTATEDGDRFTDIREYHRLKTFHDGFE